MISRKEAGVLWVGARAGWSVGKGGTERFIFFIFYIAKADVAAAASAVGVVLLIIVK